MSWGSNPDSALAGGWLTSAYPGLGILGAAIPASGDNGGSPVLNDGINAAKEYRWALVTSPSAGTITLFEDLTCLFSGAPDGIYTTIYRLWEDGVDQGTATITLQVGPSHTMITATLAGVVGSVISAPSPKTMISAALANIFGAVTSASGTSLATISAPLANISGAIASRVSPKTSINATLGGISGSVVSSAGVVTTISANLAAIVGSVAAKSSPVTTIIATLNHITGAITSSPAGVAATQLGAVLQNIVGNVNSVGQSVSLSQADINNIVAALLMALQATRLPVNVVEVLAQPVAGEWPTAIENADALLNRTWP